MICLSLCVFDCVHVHVIQASKNPALHDITRQVKKFVSLSNLTIHLIYETNYCSRWNRSENFLRLFSISLMSLPMTYRSSFKTISQSSRFFTKFRSRSLCSSCVLGLRLFFNMSVSARCTCVGVDVIRLTFSRFDS